MEIKVNGSITITGLEPLLELVKAMGSPGISVEQVADKVAEKVERAASTPVQFAPVQPAAPAAVPVTPVAAPVQPAAPAAVPIALPPTVSLDQIKIALANLADAGNVDAIMQLFGLYGISCADDLTPDKLGAFATDLRQRGGKI